MQTTVKSLDNLDCERELQDSLGPVSLVCHNKGVWSKYSADPQLASFVGPTESTQLNER